MLNTTRALIAAQSVSSGMPPPAYSHLTFSSLFLLPPILSALTSLSYLHPSPIQLHCIPPALHGLDLIAQAHSGTGKSLVFASLALTHTLRGPPSPRPSLTALILVPTRELGVQVEGVVQGLAQHVRGVRVESVMGGKGGIREDRERLVGCDVLIATVGRLRHLMEERLLRVEGLTLLVLDEADALLSPSSSFTADVDAILAQLPAFPQRQTLLFSATWATALMARAREVTAEAQLILLDSQKPQRSIQHLVLYVDVPRTTQPAAPATAEEQRGSDAASSRLPPSLSSAPSSVDPLFDAKLAALLSLLSSFPFHQCLVFARSAPHVALLPHSLTVHGYPTHALSGELEPAERASTLAAFRSLHLRILVTSDLLSRGFDHPTVNLVVHWDDAYNPEAFLHRGGRTGRWGRKGRTVWLVERGGEERVQRMRQLTGVELVEAAVVDGRAVLAGDDGSFDAEVRRQRGQMKANVSAQWALRKFTAARSGALEEMDDEDRAKEWGSHAQAVEAAEGNEGEEEGEEGGGEDEEASATHVSSRRETGEVLPLVVPFSPFAEVRLSGAAPPLLPSSSSPYPLLDPMQLNSYAVAAAAQFHRQRVVR